MNKTELIDNIAASAGISKADAKKALDATTEAIKNALVAGDKVQLVGFAVLIRVVQAHRLFFDGDAALTLQLHRV